MRDWFFGAGQCLSAHVVFAMPTEAPLISLAITPNGKREHPLVDANTLNEYLIVLAQDRSRLGRKKADQRGSIDQYGLFCPDRGKQ